MQFRVPQNIDMADKIVGPLTMVQFIYLLVGGMIVYAAFNLLVFSAFLAVSIPVGFLALSFAFLKVQDQPFGHFFVALLFYLFRPKSRLWQKSSAAPTPLTLTAKETSAAPAEAVKKRLTREDIAGLAQTIDQPQP